MTQIRLQSDCRPMGLKLLKEVFINKAAPQFPTGRQSTCQISGRKQQRQLVLWAKSKSKLWQLPPSSGMWRDDEHFSLLLLSLSTVSSSQTAQAASCQVLIHPSIHLMSQPSFTFAFTLTRTCHLLVFPPAFPTTLVTPQRCPLSLRWSGGEKSKAMLERMCCCR